MPSSHFSQPPSNKESGTLQYQQAEVDKQQGNVWKRIKMNISNKPVKYAFMGYFSQTESKAAVSVRVSKIISGLEKMAIKNIDGSLLFVSFFSLEIPKFKIVFSMTRWTWIN